MYYLNDIVRVYLLQKLLEELENEEIPAHIRESRLQNLKQQASQFRNMHEKGYGRYRSGNISYFLISFYR